MTTVTHLLLNCTFARAAAVSSGVRHGGVLSAYLYAIYVDDVINEL